VSTLEWLFIGGLWGITGIYFITILYFFLGWKKLKHHSLVEKESNIFISIIIPVRNEAGNIEKCLQSILAQHYSSDRFEIIVVNDHSEDDTVGVLEQFGNSITIIHLKEEIGKKEAITTGTEQAKGELIVTIDADVLVQKEWLSKIAAFYNQTQAKMIIMPVAFHNEKGFFQQLQSVEFMSLIGSAAGAAGMGNPFMCNGANLAFEKSAFNAVNGYQNNTNLASGDDVFLLHKIKRQFKGGVQFINDKSVIVYTSPKRTMKGFIHQRIRWAGKAKHYKDGFSIFLSWLVLLLHVSLTGGLIALCFNCALLIPLLVAIGLKWGVDLLFMGTVANHFGKARLLVWFPIQQVAYLFYVLYIALAINMIRPNWKGRKL
jgi:biofilm PGA synthesis N-glycosyltransferase PgaC